MKFKTLLMLLVLAGAVALLFRAVQRRPGTAVPEVYRYSTESYAEPQRTAARLFDELPPIPLALLEPRALAAGPDGSIAAVGDKAMLLLDRAGRETRRIRLTESPTCVAWEGSDIFVGFRTHIEVYASDGNRTQIWQTLGENAWLTGLAADTNGLFVADYGQRTVWLLDREGRLLRSIDGKSPDADSTGFVTPSPFFDVAASAGTVWITNPGRQRVEAYGPDGKRQAQWGRASTAIEDFCGCCNPSHLARMTDGRFVTSEKGMPRVKLYTADGTFLGVVATTGFNPGAKGLDLAVDSEDRILVLNPPARHIRLFVEKRHD